MTEKSCPSCQKTLHLSCFTKDAQKKDGLSSYCKDCKSLKNQTFYLKSSSPLRKNVCANGLSQTDPNAYSKLWAQKNPEKRKQALKKWAEKNRSKLREKGMRRYASQTNQTPKWLTAAHKAEMEGMYQFCQAFPTYQVDHIVPIRGKCVSGLHVPWNLQVIPKEQNLKKSNFFNPSTYPLQGQCAFLEEIWTRQF